MIWSIVPSEFIFQNLYEPPTQGKKETLHVGGVVMVVEVTGFGQAKIERLISPNAGDYLKPEWMPGQVIRLFP